MGLWALILGLIFYRSFIPKEVVFSNDGPLGGLVEAQNQLPQTFTGMWADLNSIGSNAGATTPSISSLLRLLLGPVGFAKFFAPVALFILGMGAWTFFRSLKLSSLAAVLGSLATVLSSTFFSTACWGVASQQIALGMDFCALSLIIASTHETRTWARWTRLALAGLCVGMNVMEAADIGALCSLFVAAFAFYYTLTSGQGSTPVRIARGIGHVALVAVFAGFIAIQTVISLVGTQIEGVAGTTQDTQTKIQRWDWATQWSLPKKETLGLIVPGLFGYKMDTPKDMMPTFADSYQGGVYWGGMGRSPEIDRFLDSGGQGNLPPGFMRFSGGGNYCGILVWLIAGWTVAQLFRRKKSLFVGEEKKVIWFWTFVLIVALPLAWGRFAPFSESSNGFLFYALLYKLPYFSTIRNPAKFLIFLAWAVAVLFAYGVHALDRRYLVNTTSKPSGLLTQLGFWWKTTDNFDRKWMRVMLGILGFSVVGWLIYASQKSALIHYLEKMGFPDADFARQIAGFSIGQVGWFLALAVIAVGILTLVIAGYFVGTRAKTGMVLLGAFLVFDLGRANLPYVIHWNYKQKYEVGSLNPIVDFLRKDPYEHRVAGLPFHAPQGLELLDQLYRIEWMQHLFLYHNIQCLDIVQMPRMPEDLKTYLEALSPNGTEASVPLMAREWELTNTRYLLGPAGFLDVMNQQLDPEKHRFQIAQRFEIVPKPGILNPTQLEELTAVPNQNGRYALFDFTGALPRAKLYSNWLVNTNDGAVLKTLADLKFDPHQTVLVDMPEKNLPSAATNDNNGTVEFKSYAPKHIALAADAKAPSVLLLNDKFDPNWSVNVDGQPAKLLRCNYIMRGVYLQPGQHTVTFQFSLPNKPLYITLAAMGVGLILCGILLVSHNPKQ
jgi:hypothetical protein